MQPIYSVSIEEALALLGSSPQGLSSQEAKKRLAHYGPNVLPSGSVKPLWKTFFEQFKNPIIFILLFASLISFIIGEDLDGWFIFAVLLINASIGTYLEHSAQKKAHSLKKSVKIQAKVLRDGLIHIIPAEEITIGDIVLLESGDKVPADMRLIESHNLLVDESLLTGESIAVQKDASVILPPDTPLADRKNMVYAGTLVLKGRGKGVVCAIGKNSEIGKIASLLAQKEEVKIPLVQKLEKLSYNIAIAVAIASIFILFIALLRHYHLQETFFLILALFVSAVPEGLPVAITVALAAAALAMAKREVIVQKLSAIETLGSCTLIATDKTGTLTKNRLEVQEVISPITDPKFLGTLLVAATEVKETPKGWEGDQVDTAFVRFGSQFVDPHSVWQKRVDILPYESELKMSGAVIKQGREYLHIIKGSPEVIASYVKEPVDLSELDKWAQMGYRLIAFAYKRSDSPRLSLQKDFIWGGFVALLDPIREDVYDAVAQAQEAGITVVMITGDHPKTAFKIAYDLKIALSYEEVMEGRYLDKASKEEILQTRVFARVTPEQKLMIVRIFQEAGHIVAVTGDGVNDAPALKFAHIGIAMGSGSDVAKESAQIIITNDSFSSIVAGIEEGRRAYDNIRKVVHLLISTGFAEIVLIVLSLAFATPIPLLPVHLLWLNLVTNGIQDVALGLEPAEPDIMKRPPRDPKEPILNTVMIRRILVGGGYMAIGAFGLFYHFLSTGIGVEEARNSVLFLMVLFENAHVLNSRSEYRSIFAINHFKNPLLLGSVVMAQGVHIAAMYTPFMQKILHIAPIDTAYLPVFLLLAVGLVAVMEIEKYLRTR